MPYTLLIVICLLVFFTSLILLNFGKIKNFFVGLTLKHKSKKEGNKLRKVKVNENQFRPILKPPEAKLLNEPKEVKENGNNYDNNNKVNEKTLFNNNTSGKTPKFSDLNTITLDKDNLGVSSRYKTNNNEPKFKNKEELDKEFDEIRKFLDLPTKKTDQSKNFNGDRPFVTNLENVSFVKNNNGIKLDSNKDFAQNVNPYFKYNSEEENIVKVDGDEIDLNKLPPKLRKFLIANIFERKSFD